MKARPFGIDTVILVAGAFTSGTDHFAHAVAPADPVVVAQYRDLPARAETLDGKLGAIDAAHGGPLDVAAVGEALRDMLALPRGQRPLRVFVDEQHEGVEDITVVQDARQRALLDAFGMGDLAPPLRP